MSALFAAGLILLALAAAADFLGGRVLRVLRSGPLYLLGAAGSGCLAATGGYALTGRLVTLNIGGWLGDPIPGQRAASLAADRLSGLFLAMAFGAALPISVAFASWAWRQGPRPGRLGASYALALGAVAVVVTARDAFTFLFGWEALTVAFYLLAGGERHRRDRAGAAQITFAFGKLSGAALLIGLLLLATRSHSLLLASYAHVPGGAARTAAQVLLLLGFAIKAGLVPFQIWLPRGYAAAPGPARAIMAGVCVNVAFYGMWRTLALLGRAPGWLVGVVLLLGAMSALLGIAHAAVQNRLSRVIAYSSIENTGLIVIGFGVALTGAAIGNRMLVATGLLAATLQMVAHTAAKSLLFTSAAGLEAGAGGDDLEQLRARARRTPWSGFGLVVGSVTLAGLPPSVGFVSEWFLLESLMQQFRVPGLGYRLVLALAGAAVALTAGFAGVTFVRLVGLVVKRDGPEPVPGAPLTYGWSGRAAVLALSVCCLAISAVTPLEIRVIAAGLSPVMSGGLVMGALKSPWVVQPVFAGFSILSPSWLWLVMPVMLLLVVLFTWAMSGRRLLRVRRVPAWHSATMGVDGLDSYTAFGYANPTRRVLAGVLHTRAEVQEIMLEDPDPDQGAGPPDRPGDPEPEEVAHLRYASDVMEVVEAYLYRPLLRAFLAVVAVAKRLQNGRLDAYLLYMLIALIAVIAVVTALA
jgi:formate hydrogenlyase subunit 3/multisubunit Na+/H+ antiporter MnhD subunit